MSIQARKIYLLDPQKLSPETIAVAFAKTSRSPKSFQDIAAELTDEQIQWFWDSEQGGFFFTSSDHQETIVRLKHPIDGAVPSGISVSAENLHALIGYQLQGVSEQRVEKYRTLLRDTVRSVMPLVSRAPVAATRMGSVAIGMQSSSE